MITYSTENVKMPAIRRRDTSAWIRRVAATYHKKVGEVGYLFCDDEHILHLCGINDKGPGERELMEAAEDRALKAL